MEKIRGLWKLPNGRDSQRGKLGLVLMGGAMLSKSLLQFSIKGQGYVLSKITADGDCSHEIKKYLLFERKVMTNLDSIFKSTDITLSTKVHLVKAMVFPVVMYGCESWTIKKAER